MAPFFQDGGVVGPASLGHHEIEVVTTDMTLDRVEPDGACDSAAGLLEAGGPPPFVIRLPISCHLSMPRGGVCRQPGSGGRIIAGVAFLGVAGGEAKRKHKEGHAEELRHGVYIRRVRQEDKWNDANLVIFDRRVAPTRFLGFNYELSS